MADLTKLIGLIVAIILVDLALSGDNALVIGAAASKLQGRERRFAIVFGGGIAIILRVLLTFFAVYVLHFPYINAIGGIIIFVLALLLLREIREAEEEIELESKPQRIPRFSPKTARLLQTCASITLADLSMSLDNVLAIAGIASGNYVVLAIGLLASILLLLIASSVIAHFIEKFPILIYAAGFILAITSANMIAADKGLGAQLSGLTANLPLSFLNTMRVLLGSVFIIWSIIWYLRHKKLRSQTNSDVAESAK